jgi:hypothetical protein
MLQKEIIPCPSTQQCRLTGLLADRRFCVVLLIWALCCWALCECVAKFGAALPWADEWFLTPIATGKESLSWSWLWHPNNEHRQPLMRLGLFLIGRLSHWNWQAVHYLTLALMGLGALALLCAARSIRGRSALSDTFLCLVVLSPGQWETTWRYGYSFGAAGGLSCIALSMVAARWLQRSLKDLISYLLTVLAITLTGGPTGNLMALGLVAALAPYFRETTSRAWKITAGVGCGLILAASGVLLALTPVAPDHPSLLSNSLITIVESTLGESVCWLGPPVLQVLWPWAFLIVLLPGLWVAGRIVRDLRRGRQGNHELTRAWMDLVPVWLAAFLVAASIAYGRGHSETPWSFRYMVLTMPIGIVLYLLLVRIGVPLAIPRSMAVALALFCCWNWLLVLHQEIQHQARLNEFVRTLAQGHVPLSEECKKYCADVGLPSDHGYVALLTNWVMELRQSDQSIFRAINRRKRRAGEALPQAWEADSGKLGQGWVCLPDASATQAKALRVSAAGEKPATVSYPIQVTVGGAYQLCCRMRASKPQTVTVAVDGSQSQQETFPAAADFRSCVLAAPLKLEPGQHELTLTLAPVCADLDLLELVPKPPDKAR